MANSIQYYSFSQLCNPESAKFIGKALNSKDIFSLRLVDKACNELCNIILKKYWVDLMQTAPSGIVDIPREMAQIAHIDEVSEWKMKIAIYPANIDSLNLFKKLVEKFFQNGLNNYRGNVPITASEFNALQEQLKTQIALEKDTTLRDVWANCLYKKFPGVEDYRFINVDVIRIVLQDERNKCFINKITELNLKLFSPEIAYFPLKVLLLNGCRASYLSQEIGKLNHLTYLDLNGNRFISLPKEIGSLTNLTQLKLSYNRLTDLPKEIGGLTGLRELQLSVNRIGMLPEEIGALTELKHLYFDNNKVKALPKSIGCLTALKNLQFHYNEIVDLTSELGSLTGLERLDLYGNPIMFVADEVHSLSDVEKIMLLNHKQELTHCSESPMSKLYQAILQKNSQDEIQKIFSSLGSDDKNLIYEMVSICAGSRINLSWGEDHVFADMSVFYRAVRKAVCLKFERLSFDQKREVSSKLYFMRYDTEVCMNIPLYADLMADLETVDKNRN